MSAAVQAGALGLSAAVLVPVVADALVRAVAARRLATVSMPATFGRVFCGW